MLEAESGAPFAPAKEVHMVTAIQSGNSGLVPNVRTAEATEQPETGLSPAAQAKAELNASIVQASIDASISSKNEPLALLLQSAIDGINEALRPTLGENALQAASSQDNTPEGTAGRIVALSTGFFEAFKAQHPGEDEADVLKNFMATIRSGFEQGFKEASDILKGLNVLTGDIASNIDKTYALVMQGYADFEANAGKTSVAAEDAVI